jgi:class 3 adenylate cyclase
VIGKTKFHYDLWGDTVNTASRMESHGEVGKIQVTQQTYDLLRESSILSLAAHSNQGQRRAAKPGFCSGRR